MPRSLSKNPILPRQTNPEYTGQLVPTSSMHTLEDALAPQPYSSLEPSSSQRYSDSRSRPRDKTFGMKKKKKEKKNSILTLGDSERSKKDPGETRTVLTNLKTFFVTPNCPSLYRLRSKICLPARYLLTLQTEQENSRQNSIWFSDNSRGLR
jgi:hypothetical protein